MNRYDGSAAHVAVSFARPSAALSYAALPHTAFDPVTASAPTTAASRAVPPASAFSAPHATARASSIRSASRAYAADTPPAKMPTRAVPTTFSPAPDSQPLFSATSFREAPPSRIAFSSMDVSRETSIAPGTLSAPHALAAARLPSAPHVSSAARALSARVLSTAARSSASPHASAAPPSGTSASTLNAASAGSSQKSRAISRKRSLISPWASHARRGKITHLESRTKPSSGTGRASVTSTTSKNVEAWQIRVVGRTMTGVP